MHKPKPCPLWNAETIALALLGVTIGATVVLLPHYVASGAKLVGRILLRSAVIYVGG